MSPIARRTIEHLLSFLQAVVPKTDIALVYGYPNTEGNATEVASALARRYVGRLVYLVDGDPATWSTKGATNSPIYVRKSSLKAMYLYCRAEIVFFTHGLFGAVKPSRRQTFVNLWHGDGIKRKPEMEASKRSLVPATYVSGGTQLLTQRKATDFKLAPDSELVFGNPRTVQFRDELPVPFKQSLGIDARPYVVWMPTFRSSAINRLSLGYEDDRVKELMSEFTQAAHAAGLTVISKAHHWDSESREADGAVHVSDAMLLEHGVSLYALLGGSAALVTDYSSVWTDYLLLDRPIGFIMPDSGTYSRLRGLYPNDVLDWLPGPRLESKADIDAFLQVVVSPARQPDQRRTYARIKLGLVSNDSPADCILDALAARRRFRKGHLVDDQFDAEKRPRVIRC